MTIDCNDSRRQFLKVLSSVPLLPISTVSSSAALLAACNSIKSWPSGASLNSISFTSMPAPGLDDPAAIATTTVDSSMLATFSDGSTRAFKLKYEPFFITGDVVSNGQGGSIITGGYFDIYNRPIMDTSAPGQRRQFFSDCPDGSSLLTLQNPSVPGVRGNTVFAVVQFEYTTRNLNMDSMYGQLPAPIAVLTLDQDNHTGKLKLVSYHNIDTSSVNGLWSTCGASLSPWNTHLSSEEYEPDAAAINTDRKFRSFSKHLYGDETRANPYHYGHLPEVTVHPDGTGSIQKHYCMGRISHELVQVMPDQRTVLMGDDATNGGLFLFIADKPADLSAGTLYVARWIQTSSTGPGTAILKWIKLGHARSREIESLIDSNRLTAADIMDIKTSDPNDNSYTRIPFSGTYNWVRLKPNMEKAAAFLETHRYAALKGGSLGFTKMEGTTVNPGDKIAYSAMSYIKSSMLNGSGGIHVEGPKSGAVYAMNLRGGQYDTSGYKIDSDWVPADMAPPDELIGEDLHTADALGNLASPDKIANPDNIKFSQQLRTLFIGEDSDMHVNNYLWAYNVDTKNLSRLLSCPAGAESTGLHAVDQINGWTYIMSNFQHPGDWKSPIHDKVKARLDPLIKANYKNRFGAAVGYLTGFPDFIQGSSD